MCVRAMPIIATAQLQALPQAPLSRFFFSFISLCFPLFTGYRHYAHLYSYIWRLSSFMAIFCSIIYNANVCISFSNYMWNSTQKLSFPLTIVHYCHSTNHRKLILLIVQYSIKDRLIKKKISKIDFVCKMQYYKSCNTIKVSNYIFSYWRRLYFSEIFVE